MHAGRLVGVWFQARNPAAEKERRVSLAAMQAERERRRAHGGAAEALGKQSHRWRPPVGSKPLVEPVRHPKGTRAIDRLSVGLDMSGGEAAQHRARSRLRK